MSRRAQADRCNVPPGPPADPFRDGIGRPTARRHPQRVRTSARPVDRRRIHAAADRDPEFRGGHARRRRGRRRRVPGHHQQSQAQRAVRADRSGRLHRAHHQSSTTAPQFQSWKTINAQALVTGRMTRQGDGRLQGRIPALGRQHRPAAHRPAIFHLAGILAADRAHHLRPDLRAADRREGLFRQPRGVRRRDRVRRSAASSGWR